MVILIVTAVKKNSVVITFTALNLKSKNDLHFKIQKTNKLFFVYVCGRKGGWTCVIHYAEVPQVSPG